MWRTATVQVFGHDAFISHSHADAAAYAADLFEQLELRDLRVALDKHDFQLAEALAQRIHRDVRRSRHLILIDTPRARESAFVAKEIAHAVARHRYVIRVGAPGTGGTNATGWRLLTVSERDYLIAAISREDSAAAFANGACSAAVVSQIRSSIGVFTVRRRVRTVLALAVSLALVAGGSYLGSRWLATRLQALNWSLERPDQSLEQAGVEVAAFADGIGGLAADWLYAPEFDSLLDRALTLTVKPTPADAGEPVVAIAPGGRTVLTGTVRDGALVVRSDAGDVHRCSTPGFSERAQFAVSDNGERLVAVDAGNLRLWNTADCSGPIATTTVAPLSVDSPKFATDRDIRTMVLVWPDRLVRLAVDAKGNLRSVALSVGEILSSVPAIKAAPEGSPLALKNARLSGDGSALVFAIQRGTGEVVAICLIKSASSSPACATSALLNRVEDYVIDASGQYLVTSDGYSLVNTWPLDVFNPSGDAVAPVARQSVDGSALAAVYGAPAVVALDRIRHVVTAFDISTLTELGWRTFVPNPTSDTLANDVPMRVRGIVRHPGYAASRAEAFPHQSCGETSTLPIPPKAPFNYSIGCAWLAVLVDQSDHTTLNLFDVRKASTSSGSRFTLRRRRALSGRAIDVQLDQTGAWADVIIDGDISGKRFQRVPLSRQAVVETLVGSGHDKLGGWTR